MKKIRELVAAVGAAALVLFAGGVADAATPKALDDLQAAYQGELQASARYLAFAAQADQEGYGKVASLFRAAARAEKVHASNHAEVIASMGAKPFAKLAKLTKKDVGTTRQNLETVIAAERYERDTMYPQFIREARAEGATDAVQTFDWARIAEAEHARLCGEALGNLEAMRGEGVAYWVCLGCGFTTARLDFDECPGCGGSREMYIQVG